LLPIRIEDLISALADNPMPAAFSSQKCLNAAANRCLDSEEVPKAAGGSSESCEQFRAKFFTAKGTNGTVVTAAVVLTARSLSISAFASAS
jgi:hypothetical protein